MATAVTSGPLIMTLVVRPTRRSATVRFLWQLYVLGTVSHQPSGLLLLAVGGGGDRFLSHHELGPSVVLNPYPHYGVCVCVCRHKAEMSAYACVVSSLCPVYFSSPATLRPPSTTLAIPSQPTHTGRESVDQ